MPRQVQLGLIALAVSAGSPLAAQVGYPPATSPYQDIVRSQALSVTVGYLSGSRGSAGVGPSDGPTLGTRYELRLAGPTDLVVSFAWAGTDRFVVDPSLPPDQRTSGPVRQNLFLADGGLVFLLTGPKTWHGIAPYVAASMGLAVGSNTPQDTSGYEFAAKFTFQPAAGVRYYAGRSVYLRLEARDIIWRLSYPLSFFDPPTEVEPVLGPGASEAEWLHHFWVSAAVGFSFRL